ncbi:hypothetical protein K450DRAFT_226333 [Umbelopsis ramanniana AG]|uniref:Uncharacterized protein n=1 Tax=Umbelopsis ramanniana AG TaxID=1314678 RepID=A0AAD5HFP2_UMBRA|nr:uncharacterized protein K450DRAFT_226333 [Umbelopsis ramanniana AG]KAI8582662.1 hypothetical protein K450DRAFT_226333 [Umbelopsis ramanniana AG]
MGRYFDGVMIETSRRFCRSTKLLCSFLSLFGFAGFFGEVCSFFTCFFATAFFFSMFLSMFYVFFFGGVIHKMLK